jgi:hypothetical protein
MACFSVTVRSNGLASAVGSPSSGVILAYAEFTALGGVGAALALIPLAALAWQALGNHPTPKSAVDERPSSSVV